MIALGSDHAGYGLKEAIKRHLEGRGLPCRDFGTDGPASVDYAPYGEAVARAVASGECERGVCVCGTGVGISLAANKVRGTRAACCSDTYTAALSRRHNDANVLCVGARVVGEGLAEAIVDAWLDASFEGGRHAARVRQIHDIELREQERGFKAGNAAGFVIAEGYCEGGGEPMPGPGGVAVAGPWSLDRYESGGGPGPAPGSETGGGACE